MADDMFEARRILQHPGDPASIAEIGEAVALFASRYMAPYRGRMGDDWEDELSQVFLSCFTVRLAGSAIQQPEHYFPRAARNAFDKWCNRAKSWPLPVEDTSELTHAVQVGTDDLVLTQLEAAALLQAVQDLLGVKEFRVYVHVELLQWTVAEYARATNSPHSSVTSQLAAARRKISKKWPTE